MFIIGITYLVFYMSSDKISIIIANHDKNLIDKLIYITFQKYNKEKYSLTFNSKSKIID